MWGQLLGGEHVQANVSANINIISLFKKQYIMHFYASLKYEYLYEFLGIKRLSDFKKTRAFILFRNLIVLEIS